MQYNEEHHIVPRQIVKEIKGALVNGTPVATDEKGYGNLSKAYLEADTIAFAADPIIERMTRPQLEKSIENTTALMKKAAKELDFIQAAQYRDEIARLQKLLEMK